MARLRIDAWTLLKPFATRTEGWPDPSNWYDARALLHLSDGANREGDVLSKIEVLHLGVRARSANAGPILYESTLYNKYAKKFIKSQQLDDEMTTKRLLERHAREIEFPPDSMAIKMFWYALKPGASVDVEVWNWRAADGSLQLPTIPLRKVCVALQPKDGCILAKEHFYTLTVATEDDRTRLSCGDFCHPDLNDTLILITLHVASKQTPEWLWATFWWRDARETPSSEWPTGDSWTCAAAQRQEALGHVGLPWSNYSMDTTSTFRRKKPELSPNYPCGVPQKIGNDEQYLATYSPFVEASFGNGLKSSCVDCHARASTVSGREAPVPPPFDPGPALQDFERHIRLDYLWMLQRSMGHTHPPN
jgi:hypothetical protein